MRSFSEYAEWDTAKPLHISRLIEKMGDYIVERYGTEIIEIGEMLINALANPLSDDALEIISEKYQKMKEELDLYNSLVEHNTTIGEYRKLAMNKLEKFIRVLEKNLDNFVEETSKDYSGYFIAYYYSIYLHFLTYLYSIMGQMKISKKKVNIKTIHVSKERKLIDLINSTVFIFGIPIVIFLLKNEIMGEITVLKGIMLHFMSRDKFFVNPSLL